MKQMDCASHVVSTFFGDRVTSVVPIVGKGSVNSVFQVNTPHNRVVVRVNHHQYLLDYQKEAWCIKQAAQKAIPSPNVLAVGRYDDCAYMIESFIVGDNGDDSLVDQRYIWRKLGSYMKLIGSIPVKGFGEHLSDPETGAFVSPLHDGYDGTWSGFLDYNITSLTEHDPLIELGVFTARDSRLIKQAFEKLRDFKFEFGLNHGDLSLKNTIVSPDRTVHLLDWGSAEVNVTPYGDLIQV